MAFYFAFLAGSQLNIIEEKDKCVENEDNF